MVNTLLKQAIQDIAIYFPGKLLPALTGLITIPIFARLFQPAEYGILAVVGVFTAAGGIAVSNWLTSSVMRFLPHYRHKNQVGRFYSTLLCAFGLSLAALIVLGTPIYLLVKTSVNPEVYRLLPLAGLIIAVSSLFAILQTILRADQKAKHFVGAELFMTYGGLIAGLFLVLIFGFGVEGILWGSVIFMIMVSAGIVWSFLRMNMKIGLSGVSGATLREFAVYGLPGGVATIGTWLLSVSDRYIIEYFRGTAEVGLYSMGYSIADKSINLVITSLVLAIGPILINTWESENREAAAGLLGQITRITLILVIPMVVGLSILAEPVFRVFTTEAYIPGALVLPWVAFGSLIYGLSLLAYTGLIIAKKTVIMARNYLLAGLINVLLNVMLVPHFGFMAAAVNTAVAYGMLLTMNVFSSTKYLPWLFPWRTLRNVLFASGTMALLLGVTKVYIRLDLLTLLLTVAAGMSIYLLMLVVIQEVRKEELRGWQSMIPPFLSIWKRFFIIKSNWSD